MGGIDYDFQDRWRLQQYGDTLDYVRRRPGRLRDREALDAVITALTRYSGTAPTVTVNDLTIDSRDALTILDHAGPRVRNIFLSSSGEGHYWSVQFYSRPMPHTRVSGPLHRGGDVNALTSLVDSHTRRLGVRGALARARFMRWVAPSVVQRMTRDARRESRARWSAVAFGFLGGAVASVLGQVAGTALRGGS